MSDDAIVEALTRALVDITVEEDDSKQAFYTFLEAVMQGSLGLSTPEFVTETLRIDFRMENASRETLLEHLWQHQRQKVLTSAVYYGSTMNINQEKPLMTTGALYSTPEEDDIVLENPTAEEIIAVLSQ